MEKRCERSSLECDKKGVWPPQFRKKMLTQNWFMLFFVCLLIIARNLSVNPNTVEATRVLTINRNRSHFKGYTKRQVYSTLGMVCECCDGKAGECTTTWDDACSNLKCHPWKY
ncbi:hypothetical protein DEO72_LG6g3259 [Vigna unguiculata]|uniref:Uncharacterized protein n=1 Tax=Vigna unguiculata TaxID=3917 RepID=A0A4D6MC20_VIGUN|nr:hypothetical protein DEO72_LG6g3259 [Vigna unguiculata]